MTEKLYWQPTWTQAMTDFRGESEEQPFANVTVRMTVPASIGGSQIRVELSNRFGSESLVIGRAAIMAGHQSVDMTFDGEPSIEVTAGGSVWTDPINMTVNHSESVCVDLYLPRPTPYATANGFSFQRSTPGDFAGSHHFKAISASPTIDPDETDWSLPPGGPFLRTIEVAAPKAQAVIVCLGSSSTAMGWPQIAAALLSAEAKISILNRGIAGNRLRFDAPRVHPSWGRSGLSRFDEDVLGTRAVTHVVISYNSNDWGLPGRITSLDEMPSLAQMIESYKELINRAHAAGLQAILATITPLAPELLTDLHREDMRLALNGWIRRSGNKFADFDAAIRSTDDPSRLDPKYAAPDHTHPNVNGARRLAQVMTELIAGDFAWRTS